MWLGLVPRGWFKAKAASECLSYGSVELCVAQALNVVNIQKKSLGLNSEDWGRTFLADGPLCLHSLPLDSKPACLQEKVKIPSAHSGLC